MVTKRQDSQSKTEQYRTKIYNTFFKFFIILLGNINVFFTVLCVKNLLK